MVEYNENEFEANMYDFFTFLHYKGQLFTGTLKDGDSTIQFKNGNADGLAIYYFPSGEISSETEYKDGEFVQEKDWYEDGKIKSSHTTAAHLKYSKDGKIAYEDKQGIATWYYKNGQIKEIKNWQSDHTTYYASNGETAIAIERFNEINYVKYFDEVLLANFKELITNFYPELDALSSNFIGDLSDHFPKYCFQLWVLKLIVEAPLLGREVLSALENFDDSKVKNMADTIKLHVDDFSLDEVSKNDYGYCGYKIKN